MMEGVVMVVVDWRHAVVRLSGCDLTGAGVQRVGARAQSRWCFRWRDLGGASGDTISTVLGCDKLGLGCAISSCCFLSLFYFPFPGVEII